MTRACYIRKRRAGASSGSKCIHRKAALASPSAPRHTHTTTPAPTRHTPHTRTQTHKRRRRTLTRATRSERRREIVALDYKATICGKHNLPTFKGPIFFFAPQMCTRINTDCFFLVRFTWPMCVCVFDFCYRVVLFVFFRLFLYSVLSFSCALLPRYTNHTERTRTSVVTAVVGVLEQIAKEGRKEGANERNKSGRRTEEE